ncbi:MAG: hypothetical protein WCE44_05660 [Candidatus Velthaea sp.]
MKHRVEIYIVASRKLRIESAAEFEEGRYAPVDMYRAGRRCKHARDDGKKRALAAPIAPDDADRLTTFDPQIERRKRHEVVGPGTRIDERISK